MATVGAMNFFFLTEKKIIFGNIQYAPNKTFFIINCSNFLYCNAKA